MNILAINTSANVCSVSFIKSGNINTLEKKDVKDHSEYLAVYCKKLIGKQLDSIDFIAVAIGPGSYSGIKVGVSFSKGLSMALSKPIIPVDTFYAMNESINNKSNYYISLYSHRDYIYQQLYSNGVSIEKAKCTKYDILNKYTVYGYGLENIENFKFENIVPGSKSIGLYAKKNYQKLVVKDINKIKPKYLSI